MLTCCINRSQRSINLCSRLIVKTDFTGLSCSLSLQRNINSTGRMLSKEGDTQQYFRIYSGPLTPQIRAVKFFSLGSSVAGVIAQPVLIREASTIGSTSLLIAMCSVVGFFTFITPILLHLITKKYVTHIEYNEETSSYRAVTISFFLIERELDFKPEDVVVPEVPGMFTSIIVKNKPLFIEAQHFSDPRHYAKLLGYDKPLDFKLGRDDQHSNASTKNK